MGLCFNSTRKRNVFLVSTNVHPQTIAVLKTRGATVGIDVRVVDESSLTLSESDSDVCGVLVQYPDTNGTVSDLSTLTEKAHAAGAKVVVASDLMALTSLTPPGEWGADVVFGTSQRFGVPLGFGGPHAAFFATRAEHQRRLPGRVIGVSRDANGEPALRMAMQTREQHIRRDKATSNICTAQALLANISASYAIYHGPSGLKDIATRIHASARTFAQGMSSLGFAYVSLSLSFLLSLSLSLSPSSSYFRCLVLLK